MEDTLEHLKIDQVDGLVDYSSSDDDASDASSTRTLQLWEVKDTKTWIFREMKTLRRHKNYSDIINYRYNGDAEWHNRLDSIIDVKQTFNMGIYTKKNIRSLIG